MLLNEIKYHNVTLTWLYEEDGVAWLESGDGFTADIPTTYSSTDATGSMRSFTLTENSEIKMTARSNDLDFYVLDNDQKKALYLKTVKTDEGFEITEIQIFHIVTKQ